MSLQESIQWKTKHILENWLYTNVSVTIIIYIKWRTSIKYEFLDFKIWKLVKVKRLLKQIIICMNWNYNVTH